MHAIVSSPPADTWRPHQRFSPARHWMNDPNGPLWVNGVYHLYFQYNPQGDQWGHISWGHATSPDLLHWTEQPVAVQATADELVFSGTVVLDPENHSGLSPVGAPAGATQPALLAFYTGLQTHTKIQAQCLAVSHDGGQHFQRVAGNPVLDIGSQEFRDPKVFWHAPSQRWVMLVVKALEQQVWIYNSQNLRDWDLQSQFGPAGACQGSVWEMPDLFELPVVGEPGHSRWVLVVSVLHGTLWGSSGVQYFVGDFDGRRFQAEPGAWQPGDAPCEPAEATLWADAGRDFYAPLSFNPGPDAADGQVVWIGWMSSWAYAKDTPTHPWRGQMSMPRALSLARTGQGLRLLQQPAPDWLRAALARGRTVLDLQGGSLAEAAAQLAALRLHTRCCRIECVLPRDGLVGEVAVQVLAAEAMPGDPAAVPERVLAGFDAEADTFFVHRQAREARFPGDGERHHALRPPPEAEAATDLLRFELWVDACSVELFAQGGHCVLTDLAFQHPDSGGVGLAPGPNAGAQLHRLRVTVFEERA